MSSLTPSPGALPLDEQGRLAHDALCIDCKYNLRGLAPDGLCPECGSPVVRTLDGDLLQFANPAWVRSLTIGMIVALADIALTMVLGIVAAVAVALIGQSVIIRLLIAVAASVLNIYAMVLLTRPDPDKPDPQPTTAQRSIARYGLITGNAISVCAALFQVPGDYAGISILLLGIAYLCIAASVACMGVYMATFAQRVRLPSFEWQCKWSGFLLAAGHVFSAASSAILWSIGFAQQSSPPRGGFPAGQMIILMATSCVQIVFFFGAGVWVLVIMIIYLIKFLEATKFTSVGRDPAQPTQSPVTPS